jgi:hypothetical protein
VTIVAAPIIFAFEARAIVGRGCRPLDSADLNACRFAFRPWLVLAAITPEVLLAIGALFGRTRRDVEDARLPLLRTLGPTLKLLTSDAPDFDHRRSWRRFVGWCCRGIGRKFRRRFHSVGVAVGTLQVCRLRRGSVIHERFNGSFFALGSNRRIAESCESGAFFKCSRLHADLFRLFAY